MKTPIIDIITQGGLEAYLKNTPAPQGTHFWPTLFPIKDVNTLDGKTLVGTSNGRVAAYVISYDAKTPEVGRKPIETIYFDIPKTAVARRKTEKEVLAENITYALRGSDPVIKDYFNDIEFVFNGVLDRLEWMALTALSTTKLQLSIENNPQGIVNETILDFGMPAGNKICVGEVWTEGNIANVDPIKDFLKVTKAARKAGVILQRALMTSDTFDFMCTAAKFTKYFANTQLKEVTTALTLENVNRVLTAYRIPPIVLIDSFIGIENKAGVVNIVNPWDDKHILFIPDVKVGNMYAGPIAEQIKKPDGVAISMRNNVSLSVRTQSDPVSVLTKGEMNAFPSWPDVDRCFSLYTQHATIWA